MYNNGLWNKKLTTSDVEFDNKSSLCCLDLLYITHFPTIKLAVIHVYPGLKIHTRKPPRQILM